MLTGTLPANLPGNLTELDASDCNITGPLPAWEGAASLAKISLQNNSLSGTLPAEWGQFLSLEAVFLQDNQLQGELPWWGLTGRLLGTQARVRKAGRRGCARQDEHISPRTSWCCA